MQAKHTVRKAGTARHAG